MKPIFKQGDIVQVIPDIEAWYAMSEEYIPFGLNDEMISYAGKLFIIRAVYPYGYDILKYRENRQLTELDGCRYSLATLDGQEVSWDWTSPMLKGVMPKVSATASSITSATEYPLTPSESTISSDTSIYIAITRKPIELNFKN